MSARVSRREDAGVTVAVIEGELDAASSPAIPGQLLPLIQPGGTARIDLSGVSYISSAGLRTLLLAYRHAQQVGARVYLSDVPQDIRFVMSATTVTYANNLLLAVDGLALLRAS